MHNCVFLNADVQIMRHSHKRMATGRQATYYQGNVLLFQQTAEQMLVYPKLFVLLFCSKHILTFCP